MPTVQYYFSGKARYCRPSKPNQFDKWATDLIVNKDTKKAIKAAGIRATFKEDDDGNEYVTFRRELSKEIKGELVKFDPPNAVNPDGTPFTDLIGNGSDITVKVSVFDTAMGKGARWEGVRVDKLIPYVPETPPAVNATTGALEVPF